MVTPKLIERLDSKNLSKNTALSAVRYREDYSNATAKQKRQITVLSGRNRESLYKAKTDGIISARLLVAISFILKVSPYWYSGEAEDKEDYSDELLIKFLTENKYDASLQIEQEIISKKENKIKASSTETAAEEFSSQVITDSLSYDDAVKIVESVYSQKGTSERADTCFNLLRDVLFVIDRRI